MTDFIVAFCFVLIVFFLPVLLTILLSNHTFTKVKAGEYWVDRRKNQNPFKPLHLLLIREIRDGWVLYDEMTEDLSTCIYPGQTIELNVFKRIYKKYKKKD